MYCYYDGRIVRTEDVQISPLSHSFLYGVGFFETFRTYNGEIIQFDAHINRLRRALQDFRMDATVTIAEIESACRQLNALDDGHDGYFRLNVFAKEEGLGLLHDQYTAHVLLLRKRLAVSRETEKDGWTLTIPRNEKETTIRHKSFNFLNNVKGRQQIHSLATEEGIFLNRNGDIVEGITSNIFWAKNGVIYTPSVDTGLLEGTARHIVITIARQHYEVNEGKYSIDALRDADEAWVTNAVQQMVPLKSIDTLPLKGATGDIYQHIRTLYDRWIERRQ